MAELDWSSAVTNDSKTARDVIVAALTARHEELSGEASPRDFDGARQILRALEADGFMVLRATDVTSVIRNIGEGAGSEHYRYGRETARDDAARAIEVMFEVNTGRA